MKEIDCSSKYLPVICHRILLAPTPYTQCIACVEDGKAIAGVLYDLYNTVSIHAHIWIEDGKLPSKGWFAAIFDYPFNQLGVRKIVGQVASSNTGATKLDKNFGFVEECRISDFSPEGDLIFYTMTREQCKILSSPKWHSTVLKLVGNS